MKDIYKRNIKFSVSSVGTAFFPDRSLKEGEIDELKYAVTAHCGGQCIVLAELRKDDANSLLAELRAKFIGRNLPFEYEQLLVSEFNLN